MTCPDCTRAASDVWGGFRTGCQGCKARAVARSPAFAESRSKGLQTREYRQVLDKLQVTHQEAVEAFSNDFQARRFTWAAML